MRRILNGTIESVLWAFPSVDAPTNFKVSIRITQSIHILSVLFFSFVVAALVYRLHAGYDGNGKKFGGRQRFLLYVMFFVALFSLSAHLVNILLLHFTFHPESLHPSLCKFGMKLTPTFYMGSMVANYLYLSEKAKALIEQRTSPIFILHKMTHFIAIFGGVLMALSGLVLFEGSLVFSEGYCTFNLPFELVLIGMVSDTGLSLCFMYLFFWPIRRHVNSMITLSSKKQSCSKLEMEAKRILKLARKNFQLGAIQIISTFLIQLVGLLLVIFFEPTYQNAYQDQIRYSGYSLDMIVNMLALLLNNKSWYPAWFSRSSKVAAGGRNARNPTAQSSAESTMNSESQ